MNLEAILALFNLEYKSLLKDFRLQEGRDVNEAEKQLILFTYYYQTYIEGLLSDPNYRPEHEYQVLKEYIESLPPKMKEVEYLSEYSIRSLKHIAFALEERVGTPIENVSKSPTALDDIVKSSFEISLMQLTNFGQGPNGFRDIDTGMALASGEAVSLGDIDLFCKTVANSTPTSIDYGIFNRIIMLLNIYPDKQSLASTYLENYLDACNTKSSSPTKAKKLLNFIPLMLWSFSRYFPVAELLKMIIAVDEKLQGFGNNMIAEGMKAADQYNYLLAFVRGKFATSTSRSGFRESWSQDPSKVLLLCVHLMGGNHPQKASLAVLPPPIQWELLANPKLEDAFIRLCQLMEKVNKKAPTVQKRNVAILLATHHQAIGQMLAIFAEAGMTLMRSQIAGTLLSLERLFESIPFIPKALMGSAQRYVRENMAAFTKGPNLAKDFISVLQAILVMYEAREYDSSLTLKEVAACLNPEKSPAALLLKLMSGLIKKMLYDTELKLNDKELLTLFDRIAPKSFLQLMIASQKMKDNKYRAIYLRMVICDLIGGDIDKLLHDINQADEVGQRLALHNAAIRQRLADKGIVWKKVLAYDKKLDFIATSGGFDSTADVNSLLVLWSDALQVYEQVLRLINSDETHPDVTKLTSIKIAIEQIKAQLNAIGDKATNAKKYSVLSKPSSLALLKKVNSNLKALETGKAVMPDQFQEFSIHFQNRFARLSTSQKRSAVASMHHFRIEQWDKADPRTFFLANYVACCLATNASQFPAMVQRRMDDAMLFHVAKDMATGQPAALLWVYLAETHNGEVVCMVNFAEVRAGLGSNNNLRQAILDNLLRFTSDYCHNNGIERMYVNQLTYGWNKGDLGAFELEDCPLKDKLGGAFNIDPEEAKSTVECYYLNSLVGKHRFHRITTETLEGQLSPHGKLVTEILENAVAKLPPDVNGMDQIVRRVAQDHAFELKPFYAEPLVEDSNFREDVARSLRAVKKRGPVSVELLDRDGLYSAPKRRHVEKQKPGSLPRLKA